MLIGKIIYVYGKISKAKEYLWASGVGKFPEARRNYTTFEKQLLAYYWALIDMEQFTIDHTVILRPQVPKSCNGYKFSQHLQDWASLGVQHNKIEMVYSELSQTMAI